MNKGEHTPITLAINMEKIAMSLRGKAFSLLVQPLVSVWHSSGTTESAWGVKMEMIIKKIEKSLTSEEAIDFFLNHPTCKINCFYGFELWGCCTIVVLYIEISDTILLEQTIA